LPDEENLVASFEFVQGIAYPLWIIRCGNCKNGLLLESLQTIESGARCTCCELALESLERPRRLLEEFNADFTIPIASGMLPDCLISPTSFSMVNPSEKKVIFLEKLLVEQLAVQVFAFNY